MADEEQVEKVLPAEAGEVRFPRLPRWLLIGVLVAVLVYLLTLVLYARSGHTSAYVPETSTPTDGVTLTVQLGDLTALSSRLHAEVTILPGPGLVAPGELAPREAVDVVVVPAAGTQQLRFPAGQVPATVPVELLLEGEIQNWPFDRYTGTFVVQALHGADARAIPLRVEVGGPVTGWTTRVEPTTSAETAVTDGLQLFEVSVARAGGTLVFGAILLVVLVAMPVLALFVCYQVLRGRRRAEPAFTGWIAAMLFATVPLRTFLPGSPPAGSWVDITIVLWVIVGLVLALVMYVAAWWRQGAPAAPGDQRTASRN